MRAVIVEISGKFAAALSDDGCITKITNNNYVIGQVIDMSKVEVKRGNNKLLMAVSALAAAFLMVCGIGAYGYMTPYSYVSVDVNPSIEYELNRFDRVLKVTAVNDDGKKIVEEIDVKSLSNKKINEAIQVTLDQLVNDGFLVEDQENNVVYIATYGKDQQKADKLAENISKKLSEDHKEQTIIAEPIGKERVEEAKALGVTPGKLNLVQKLQASSTNPEQVKLEEWLDKSVKEIMKATKDNRHDDKKDNDDDDKKDNSSSSSKPDKPANPNKPIKPEDNNKNDDDDKKDNSSSSSKPDKPANPNKPIKPEDNNKNDDDNKKDNSSSSSKSDKPANPNKPIKPEDDKKNGDDDKKNNGNSSSKSDKPANPNKPIK